MQSIISTYLGAIAHEFHFEWQMTERTGGSDVSNTETIAIAQPDGSYQLYGYKVRARASLASST